MTGRHVLALFAALLFVSAVTGCKKTRVACAEPPEKPRDLDDLDDVTRRMIEAAKKDPSLCRELAAPRISLTGQDLVLAGPKEYRIARRVDLPVSEIQRIDRMYDRLRAYRAQFRTVHPTMSTQPVDLRLDPALETARAASVILTAAYAGYAEARVTVGGAPSLPIAWFRHGPPDTHYIESLLRVEATSDTAFTVQVRGPVCEKGPVVTTTAAELGALVSRLCREHKRVPREKQPRAGQIARCVDAVELRAHPTSRIGDTASVLRALVDALAGQKPTPEIALLLAGSEPKMKLFPRSFPGVSVYAPGVDASGHCTSPDGGSEGP